MQFAALLDGGRFGRTIDLSGAALGVSPPAVAARGTQRVVVWRTRRDDVGRSPVFATASDNGGGFARPQRLQQADRSRYGFEQSGMGATDAAFDAGGATHVGWQNADVIELARRPPGGVFEAGRVVSPPRAVGARLGVDDAGNVTLVWTRITGQAFTANERISLEARTVSTGGDLGPVEVLARGRFVASPGDFDEVTGFETIERPDVAVDAAGNSTAVWFVKTEATSATVMAARRTAGGVFEAPVTVAANIPCPCPTGPRALTAGDGRAIVAWEDRKLKTRTFSGGGALGSVESPPGRSALGDLAVSPSGNLIAIWREPGSTLRNFVLSAAKPFGGHFARPVVVGIGAEPSVAVDAAGSPTAAFTEPPHDPGVRSVLASVYDPAIDAPPILYVGSFVRLPLGEAIARGIPLRVESSEPVVVATRVAPVTASSPGLALCGPTLGHTMLRLTGLRRTTVRTALSSCVRRHARDLRGVSVIVELSARDRAGQVRVVRRRVKLGRT